MNLKEINRFYTISQILTKSVLKKEYLKNGLSKQKITAKYSVSRWYIEKLLNNYNIHRRGRKEALLMWHKHNLCKTIGKNNPNYGKKGKEASNYKHGSFKKCKCGKIMRWGSKKCKECANVGITKKFLMQEYIQNKKSMEKIASMIKCSIGTIFYNLKKFKIKSRSCKEVGRLGSSNNNYIDGRTSNIYFCKKCMTPIRYPTFFRGKGMCISCTLKERFKNPKEHPSYIDGRSVEPYSFEFNEELKSEIRKRDNYTCQNKGCNMTEEEHLIVYGQNMTIHHIDYTKKNNTKNNLITVCKQCNTRANSNRNIWQQYYKKIIEETNNLSMLQLRSAYVDL